MLSMSIYQDGAGTKVAHSMLKEAISLSNSSSNRKTLDSSPLRTLKRLGAAGTLLFLIATVTVLHNYDMWGIFHYYLGAKYFAETGYFGIYSCAIEADNALGGAALSSVQSVRELATYRIVRRSELGPCPVNNFSRRRWSQFTNDFESAAEASDPRVLAAAFTDKGFNPPPSWVFIAKPFANAIGEYNGRFNAIILNLDIVAVLIAIVLIWRSSGAAAAILTASLAVFYFGNISHIGGNFLQYIWFPFVVASAVLWRRGKAAFSGAALGVAVGLQAFPAFFAVPVFVQGIANVVNKRTREHWRPHALFCVALAVALLLSFCLGSMAGRGMRGWQEWQSKISLHKNYLAGEIFNIGLPNLVATVVSPHVDSDGYLSDYKNTLDRINELTRHGWVYALLCAVSLLGLIFAVVRAPAADLFGYGLLFMYISVSSSPYYYFAIVLIPFLFWQSTPPQKKYAITGAIVLLAGHLLLFKTTSYVSFRFIPHLLSECGIASFLAGLVALGMTTGFHSDTTESKPLARIAV